MPEARAGSVKYCVPYCTYGHRYTHRDHAGHPSDHNAETNIVRGNATGHEVQLGGGQFADSVGLLHIHDESPVVSVGRNIPPSTRRFLTQGSYHLP